VFYAIPIPHIRRFERAAFSGVFGGWVGIGWMGALYMGEKSLHGRIASGEGVDM
jgi:hypothetical protein